MNVLWKINTQVCNCVGSIIGIDMGHIVNSRELSIDTSGTVENAEVLIDSNAAPMRYEDVSGRLLEVGQGIWECEEDVDLGKGQWRQVCVWAIGSSSSCLAGWRLTLIVDLFLLN